MKINKMVSIWRIFRKIRLVRFFVRPFQQVREFCQNHPDQGDMSTGLQLDLQELNRDLNLKALENFKIILLKSMLYISLGPQSIECSIKFEI